MRRKVTVPSTTQLDITLRSGLVYSNGATLDANAVKTALERNIANPHTGAFQYAADISSINVAGPTSLSIEFSQPVSGAFYPLLADQDTFLALPTGPSTGVPNTNVVGAGPFVLKSYTPGQQIVLAKNPRYWDAKSISLQGIKFVNVPAGPQQVNALETNLDDVETDITSSFVSTLAHDPSLQLNSIYPDASSYLVAVCKSSGPLSNVKVRQALNYAINRNAINQALFSGRGIPAWSFFPSTSPYYDKSLTNDYAFNVKKAKQLLTEAGYPHGFTTSMMYVPLEEDSQVASVLQEEWKQIGVTLKLPATSNFFNSVYVLHQASMALAFTGLPGLSKLTTTLVPPDSGDLCGYSNPTLDSSRKAVGVTSSHEPEIEVDVDRGSGPRAQERG